LGGRRHFQVDPCCDTHLQAVGDRTHRRSGIAAQHETDPTPGRMLRGNHQDPFAAASGGVTLRRLAILGGREAPLRVVSGGVIASCEVSTGDVPVWDVPAREAAVRDVAVRDVAVCGVAVCGVAVRGVAVCGVAVCRVAVGGVAVGGMAV